MCAKRLRDGLGVLRGTVSKEGNLHFILLFWEKEGLMSKRDR